MAQYRRHGPHHAANRSAVERTRECRLGTGTPAPEIGCSGAQGSDTARHAPGLRPHLKGGGKGDEECAEMRSTGRREVKSGRVKYPCTSILQAPETFTLAPVHFIVLFCFLPLRLCFMILILALFFLLVFASGFSGGCGFFLLFFVLRKEIPCNSRGDDEEANGMVNGV